MEPKEYRLLIVEDEDDFAYLLDLVLSPLFTLERVGTLEAAAARLAAQPKIDAVLLDLILPNSIGTKAVHELHKRFMSVPLIVISGATDIAEADILNAGAQEFIPKPVVNVKELGRIIVKTLMRQRVWLDHLESQVQLRLLRAETTGSLQRLEKVAERDK